MVICVIIFLIYISEAWMRENVSVIIIICCTLPRKTDLDCLTTRCLIIMCKLIMLQVLLCMIVFYTHWRPKSVLYSGI